MKHYKIRQIYRKLPLVLRKIKAMQIPTYASHACYFIVLAAFPSLLLMVGILRYTALEASDLMSLLEGSLPDALEPYIWRIISGTYESASKTVISVSAVLALWSAGKGMHGLLNGLNGVYGVREKRSWLRIRLTSVCYTMLFILVLLMTAALHVFGDTIGNWLRSSTNPVVYRWIDWLDWGFFAVVAVQTLLFSAMFMFLPDKRNGFRESLPGALFGSLGWMTFSALFSLYVENFNRYTNIYGSVYAVALSMLWLYMCVSIVFYGGVLNRLLKEYEQI